MITKVFGDAAGPDAGSFSSFHTNVADAGGGGAGAASRDDPSSGGRRLPDDIYPPAVVRALTALALADGKEDEQGEAMSRSLSGGLLLESIARADW